MKKIVCLLLISMGMFSSCVENPEENPEPGVPVANMLVKRITTDVLGLPVTADFTYSGKKLLEEIDSDGSKSVFTYQGDLLVSDEEFVDNVLSVKSTYVYDIDNKLVAYVTLDYDTNEGQRWVYVHNADATISFTSYKGNLTIQTVIYSTGVISATQFKEDLIDPTALTVIESTTKTYTFDTKNSPMKNVIGYEKTYFADDDKPLNYKNNIKSVSIVVDTDAPVVLNYSYIYNSNNFPTSVTTTGATPEESSTLQIAYY